MLATYAILFSVVVFLIFVGDLASPWLDKFDEVD